MTMEEELRREKGVVFACLGAILVTAVCTAAAEWLPMGKYSLSDVYLIAGGSALGCAVALAVNKFDWIPLIQAVSATYGLAKVSIILSDHHDVSSIHYIVVAVLIVLSACASFFARRVLTRKEKRKVEYGLTIEESGAAYELMESNPEEEKKATQGRLTLKSIVILLRPYYWPHNCTGRLAVFSTLLMVILSKVSSLLAPLCLSTAANAVSSGDANSVRTAALYATGYAGLTLTSKVFKEGQSLSYLRVQKWAFVDMANMQFKHVHSLSLQWALSKRMGEVVRVMDRGIAAADTLMRYGVLYVGPSIAECIATCLLFFLHFNLWELSILVFVSVTIYSILTVYLTLWRKKFRAQMNKSDNRWHDSLTESLTAFETVKVFTREHYESHKFSEAIKSYQSSSVSVQASLSILNIAQQIILCSTLAGSLILMAKAVERGDASIGAFVAVNSWVVQLFTPLNFLGTVYNSLVQAVVDLRNLAELWAQKPLVQDDPHAIDHPNLTHGHSGGLALVFNHASFDYPDAKRPILRDVSFSLPQGGSLGIIGKTGSGKSTIGRLLFRFYDVQAGSISVGGIDIRKLTQSSLRALIGVVPQDCVLFNASIAYNILYGEHSMPGRLGLIDHLVDNAKKDADRSTSYDGALQAVTDAAKRASLNDFVMQLDQGYDTIVGERGLKLSGGEKQRVAIARLFVKNPPIALFDEATSALDSRTEAQILASLEKLASARTTVTIAHRLSTVVDSDLIFVLDQGRICEGPASHKDLLELNGEYADMWRVQQAAARDERTSFDKSTVLAEEETKEG